MGKSKLFSSIMIILTFFIALYGRQILSGFINFSLSADYLKIIYFYSWWILPVLITTGLLFGFNNILNTLGIEKGFFAGFLFALITVAPMFVSSAIIGHIKGNFRLLSFLHLTLFAGFSEELLFRGFLFGILFRKLGWGFIPASIVGALFFGLGHIYQGSTFSEVIGVFLITAVGSCWFSWLYIEWHNNLWVPICLHILMNLSWTLFDVSTNALGGLYTNLFRVITIALTIIVTIRYNKKSLKINRSNFFVSNVNSPPC